MVKKLCKMGSPSPGVVYDARGLDKPAGTAMRQMRTFGQYAAVYLYDGAGEYEDANGRRAKLRAGHLLMIYPDLPHRYGPSASKPWREFYIVFDGPMFDLWRDAGLLNPAQPIMQLRPVRAWLPRFRAFAGDADQPWRKAAKLQNLLSEALATQDPDALTPAYDTWVLRAKALLEQNLHEPADLEWIAHELNMTYEGFRRRFTKQVGKPPAQYRAHCIIEQAKTLMRTSEMSDKQISAALGFCDPFYFSRRFKQVAGQTPRAFRKAMK